MVFRAVPQIFGGQRKYFLDVADQQNISLSNREGQVLFYASTEKSGLINPSRTSITDLQHRETICEIVWGHWGVPAQASGTLIDTLPDSKAKNRGVLLLSDFVSLGKGTAQACHQGTGRYIIGRDGSKYRWEYNPDGMTVCRRVTFGRDALLRVPVLKLISFLISSWTFGIMIMSRYIKCWPKAPVSMRVSSCPGWK